MSDDPDNGSGEQAVSPENVADEVLQLFDDGILRAEDFDQPPEEVAEEVRSHAATYNRVVRPVADLSGKINAVSAEALAQHFDSIENPSIEAPSEDSDELIAEFEQLTAEDSEVIRSAHDIMGQLIALYGEFETYSGESVTFQDIFTDMRDLCPETAKVEAGTFEVLARADALDRY
jgi:hypothetical protein